MKPLRRMCTHPTLIQWFKDDDLTRYRCLKCNKRWEEDKTNVIELFAIFIKFRKQQLKK